MADRNTVADSGPLIALHRIGRLEILRHLFERVYVPTAVVREIRSFTLPAWIEERRRSASSDAVAQFTTLDIGERETINLALEVSASAVLLDERDGRRAAAALGLPVLGTLRLLLRAKQNGLLVAVRPEVEQLLATDFYAAPALIDGILDEAGES